MKDITPVPPSDPGFQLMEPMANGPAPAPGGSKFRIQKFVYFLRHYWWIPLVTLVVAGGIGAFVFTKTPPTFVSYGSMWETEKLRLPDGAAFTYEQDNYIGTLTELLRSRKMWELTTNYMIAFRKNQIIWGADGNIIPVDIQIYASPKSSVYSIEARSANPAFTPAYLNALMEQYKEYRRNVRGQVSVHTESSVSEQVQVYERDMKAAQAALSDYEQSNNFAVLQQEASVDGGYLVKLRTDVSDFQLQMKLLDARSLELDAGDLAGTNDTYTVFQSLNTGNGGPANPNMITGREEAYRQVQLLKVDRARLAKYLRPEHPKMVKLDADIARAQKLVDVYYQQNRDQIVAAKQALQIKIDNYTQTITNWEAKLSAVNTKLAQADSLKQEVANKQRMYERLSALNDNVEVSQHIDQDTLDILEPASPAKRSYSEAKSMLMRYAVMGLGCGLGIIALLAFRDDRFGSLVEVTESFGDSVMGQVPEVPVLRNGEPMKLLRDHDDRHILAESYRNLRSALLYLAIDGVRPKTLLVSSAIPDEGKSTVVTNLARALALGGSKVLLIDGDLRKGHLHELLHLQSKPGLSEFLRQNDGAEKYIQATDLRDFDFLSRGSVTRNPGDLFLSQAFQQMLNRFREHYDFVLIDSSPVFAADDTSTLAPKVDGTLFVVRSNFSQTRIVREALELLFQRGARVLGLILNRTDPNARTYHFYKYEKYYTVTVDEEDTGSSVR